MEGCHRLKQIIMIGTSLTRNEIFTTSKANRESAQRVVLFSTVGNELDCLTQGDAKLNLVIV